VVARAKKRKVAKQAKAPPAPIKLDLGCGPNKRPGFVGVDAISFDGVDVVTDLRHAPWPWADASVSEAHASHFVEHLTAIERITFVNELYRVLVPGGTVAIVTPHWASCRAYGDPTHQWPPVSEFWFPYLDRAWRAANAPHTDAAHMVGGFACNFSSTSSYTIRGDVVTRNDEYQQYAAQNYKEVCQDMVAALRRED
jgi:SAM-dependent methyltransferase